MYRTEGVLALLALYVGLVQSFSWDVAVAGDKQLEFYDNYGTRTHIEDIPSDEITSLAYDPVHNSVLVADQNNYQNFSIYSFNIATRKIIFLVRSDKYATVRIAYDPITQLLFWTETGLGSTNSIFSKSGYANAVEQNLLIKLDGDETIFCITVDGCEGYIYWGTASKIERARYDGSDREVVIVKNCYERGGLAIDHQTQKIYWIDNNLIYSSNFQISIESADFNGENRRTLYTERDYSMARALLVSKDFIYWRRYETFSQLIRNPPHDKEVEPKQFLFVKALSPTTAMASNYKIEDQTQGIKNCETQKRLLPINSETNDSASLNVTTDVSLSCVHGTKVNGESRCECTQGYIGEKCEVSVCHNYCFQGDCSVSAEGHPKCRCNAGYSGERCEVNANKTLQGCCIDMDHAMTKFTDDIIKGTLRGLREEIEISIMSKLNASIKFTLSDMKQEMNTLRCREHDKLKESVRIVAHAVSRLKSPVQFQAAEQKELKERVDTVARHSSDQSQNLVSSRELKLDSLNKQVKSATSQKGAMKT